MNKKEVAEALGCSTRQVEKHVSTGRLGVKEYRRGKHGREAVYDPEQVERLRVELEAEQAQVIGTPGALEKVKPPALSGLPGEQAGRALELLAEIRDALGARQLPPAPLDTRPLWLTKAQAVEVTGLPARRIAEAVKAQRVAHIGRGSGWRCCRDDVLKLAEGLRADGKAEGAKAAKG